jgi:hypothetical protein
MPGFYRIYRLLCTSPPELDPEREVFDLCVARFNEEVLMPQRILFALGSLRSSFSPEAHTGPIEDNIRSVDFFLHICGEQPAHPAFEEFVGLGLRCVGDPGFPLRGTTVLHRTDSDLHPEVVTLLKVWASEPRCHILEFRKDRVEKAMREILAAWFEQCRQEPALSS